MSRVEDASSSIRSEMTLKGTAGAAHSATVVHDSTGQYSFNLAALACVPHYDASGNMDYVTYGPDLNGRSIRQTSTWTNGIWMGDSAWVLV